ncbi:hypothetical protein Phum_PHUM440000 [Pediculus humanus corporis]|uniref:Uncharacterized protein n=1 Tax=Pediculus humanus subsp. corporis TaxID=121224 RepID=E0VTW8_PEDHC|nr:uncharacterized protein Phum_PHUM440000 [Pediculus humanus corporis]EEB16824.1 hypothetical protein Phum_PHUM440000 [Pediculus humanus corporis]
MLTACYGSTNNNGKTTETLNFLRNDYVTRSESGLMLRVNDKSINSNRFDLDLIKKSNRSDVNNDALRLSESISYLKTANDFVNRTKIDTNNKKILPDDLRTNRGTGSGQQQSQQPQQPQQSRNNISFSVASLLADTRPRRSPSVFQSESPSPPPIETEVKYKVKKFSSSSSGFI